MNRMRKKLMILISWIACALFISNAWAADSAPRLSITGEVKQPLNLLMDDLAKFEPASARLNEVSRNGDFHGVFVYQGPSLRSLLELAGIQKGETDFPKLIDLAIIVRNKDGEQVSLSWGEVFYKNPASVIIATQAKPIIPHHPCEKCHADPNEYKSRLNELKRTPGLPKLVLADDFYTDRCIENITNIEVMDRHPQIRKEKKEPLFSPAFTIVGGKKELVIKKLSSYPRESVTAKETGDGRGYHGLKNFSGTPLKCLLDKAEVANNPGSVILASAADGYRSLLSYGEVFLTMSGQNIIIADKEDGHPIKKDGKFFLVVPSDLSADRWVKAIDKIEVIDVAKQPKLYVIGVGCGESNLITLEAVSYLAKMDTFVCSEDLKNRFEKYMGDKPILFDPMQRLKEVNNTPGITPEERKALLDAPRSEEAQKVMDALNEGKNVGFLDYGDPIIFGSWRFLQDFIEPSKIEFVSGISSFNVSNALIGRDITCNGSVVLTEPNDLKDKESMLQSVSKSGDTLAIFMGLKQFSNLVPLFQKYYANTTPVCLVYEAGYPGKEHVIRTTLQDALSAAGKEKEKWLGLIYIGGCLK